MNSIEIWNDLGNLYFKGNDLEAAINVYNKAIDLGYQSAEIFKNLASAYAGSGNYAESIPLYRKCVELSDDKKEKAIVLTNLGDCYRKIGDLDGAIDAFKTAIEFEPGNPDLCVGLTAVQRDLEKIYGFENSDEKGSLDADLNSGDSQVRKDEVRSEDQDMLGSEEEENRIQESLEDIQNPQSLEKTSLTFIENQTPEYSPKDLQVESIFVESPSSKARDDEPVTEELSEQFVPATQIPIVEGESERGEVQADQEDLPEETDYHKEESTRLTLLLTLGVMHWRNGNLEESEEILYSAIQAAEKLHNKWLEALSWHTLAMVKTSLGDVQASIEAYLRAVDLAPDQIFPWNNLGTLYNNLGAHDDAMDAFLKAIRQNPEDAASWDGLGDIYTKLGRLDDAIAAYQLGNVFIKRAQGQDAITVYEKAFSFYKIIFKSFEKTGKNDDTVNGKNEESNLGQSENTENIVEPNTRLYCDQEIADENSTYHEVKDLTGLGNDVDENIPLVKGVDLIQGDPAIEVPDEVNANVGDIFADMVSQIAENEEMAAAGKSDPKQDFEKTQPLFEKPRLTENILVTKTLSQLEPEEQPVPDEEDLPYLQHPMVMPSVVVFDTPDNEENWRYDEALGAISNPEPAERLSERGRVETDEHPEMIATGNEEQSQPAFEEFQSETDDVNHVDPVIDEPVNQEFELEKSEAERIAGTIASYEAVVKQNPNNDRAWDSLGNLYRITERNAEAILAFEQAVILQPNKYVYHYQLGSLYAAEGNYSEAIREIQQVIELNPTFIFAHCALASYLRKIGQNEEAELHIAVALPFMDREKEYDRACFESIRGNNDKALELLTIALEKKQTTLEWIKRDLDLDFIRHDIRYGQLEARFSQSTAHY